MFIDFVVIILSGDEMNMPHDTICGMRIYGEYSNVIYKLVQCMAIIWGKTEIV